VFLCFSFIWNSRPWYSLGRPYRWQANRIRPLSASPRRVPSGAEDDRPQKTGGVWVGAAPTLKHTQVNFQQTKYSMWWQCYFKQNMQCDGNVISKEIIGSYVYLLSMTI